MGGDVKKEIGGVNRISNGTAIGGKYKKTTSLLPGNRNCVWMNSMSKFYITYNDDENVWEIGLFTDFTRVLIRTEQDVPCPTVANLFEYKPERIGEWTPAPINSVIIKCAK